MKGGGRGWRKGAVGAGSLRTQTSLVSSFGREIQPEGVYDTAPSLPVWLTGLSRGDK